jgi:AcrR family transcriptional regulator
MTDVLIAEHALPAKQSRSIKSVVRLVAAAERVTRRVGPENLTVALVAKEAGVSVGALYRRFKNKDALIGAIHATRVSQIPQLLRIKLAATTTTDEVVRAYVDVLVDLFSSDESVFQAIFSAGSKDPRKVRRATETIELTFAIFEAGLLAKEKSFGRLTSREAAAMTFHLIFATMMGRIGRGKTAPFKYISWEMLREEIATVVIAYLRDAAHKKGGRSPK